MNSCELESAFLLLIKKVNIDIMSCWHRVQTSVRGANSLWGLLRSEPLVCFAFTCIPEVVKSMPLILLNLFQRLTYRHCNPYHSTPLLTSKSVVLRCWCERKWAKWAQMQLRSTYQPLKHQDTQPQPQHRGCGQPNGRLQSPLGCCRGKICVTMGWQTVTLWNSSHLMQL